MFIGKNLRKIRESKKMSLTDLAQKSGVQIATLSRIENLKMTGTVESHLNIARALDIDLPSLYKGVQIEDEPAHAISGTATTESFTFNDKASFEILTTNIFSKKMMPVILKIEPRGATNPEQNPKGSERFLFVLSGPITVHIGDARHRLKQNSSLYFDASVKHFLENPGETAARVISVTTPVAL